MLQFSCTTPGWYFEQFVWMFAWLLCFGTSLVLFSGEQPARNGFWLEHLTLLPVVLIVCSNTISLRPSATLAFRRSLIVGLTCWLLLVPSTCCFLSFTHDTSFAEEQPTNRAKPLRSNRPKPLRRMGWPSLQVLSSVSLNKQNRVPT